MDFRALIVAVLSTLSSSLALSEGAHREDLRTLVQASEAGLGSIAQEAYLKGFNTRAGHAFGSAAAVSDGTVVIGAPNEQGAPHQDDFTALSGAAYVFVRDRSNWVQQAYLKAFDTSENNRYVKFGWSVAVAGDTVVVGAPNDLVNDDEDDNFGAAYVFVREGTNWTQQAQLQASNTEGGDEFGISVAISGNTIVVGARSESSNATGINGNQSDNGASRSGAAYIFVRQGTNWIQQAYLKASNTEENDQFGISVAAMAETVVIGALLENGNATGVNGPENNAAFNVGAAYVFARNGTNWTQQAYLKPHNTGSYQFGASVAASSNTVVVGATHEPHNGTGVNSTAFNSEANMSGAAYVFVREGTTWVQQAYLKASNTGLDDNFGHAVAVSGDRVVIGAPFEDSGATGVNDPTGQSDNSARSAGAVYVFQRSGTNWAQQAYVKASNTSVGAAPNDDYFGFAVGVSGDVLVAGAPQERSSATGVNGDESNNDAQRAGAAYLFGSSIPNSPAEGLSVARGSLSYPFSGGDLFVDAAATVRAAPPVSWANGTLEVNLQPFTVGEDQLAIRNGGSGVSQISVTPAGIISFGGIEIAALADAPSGGMVVTFNGNATTEAVEAVVRNVSYSNARYSGHIASKNRERFADRTITFQLSEIGRDRGTGSRVIRFPYLTGLESPHQVFIVRNDPTYPFQLFGIYSDGSRRSLNSVGVDVGLCSDILELSEQTFGVRARHVGVGGGVCQVSLSVGDLSTYTTYYVKDECFLTFFIDQLPTVFPIALARQNVPPVPVSLGNFYALEALMNTTEPGRRVTALYWRHSQELVDLVRTNVQLREETRQVIVDFQPLLSALLSGNGRAAQITPALIDRLNLAWTNLGNAGSPALKTALENERARLGGFNTFAGKTFFDWANLLEIPAPSSSSLQLFNATKLLSQFVIEANLLPGFDYTLWKNSNPGASNWIPVLNAITDVNAWGVQITDTNASAPHLFYKVGAQQHAPVP